MKHTKRFSFDAVEVPPSVDTSESRISETLHRLRKHRWHFENGVYFKAQPICRPNGTKPAIICLSFAHRMDLSKKQDRALFERYLKSVLNEIDSMFSGVCELEFIFKIIGVPMHFAERAEDI